MIRYIVATAFGTALLICCLGASAQNVIAQQTISDSTGLTLGLVIGAISLVGWGAWQIARYTLRLEERIKRLEGEDHDE